MHNNKHVCYQGPSNDLSDSPKLSLARREGEIDVQTLGIKSFEVMNQFHFSKFSMVIRMTCNESRNRKVTEGMRSTVKMMCNRAVILVVDDVTSMFGKAITQTSFGFADVKFGTL